MARRSPRSSSSSDGSAPLRSLPPPPSSPTGRPRVPGPTCRRAGMSSSGRRASWTGPRRAVRTRGFSSPRSKAGSEAPSYQARRSGRRGEELRCLLSYLHVLSACFHPAQKFAVSLRYPWRTAWCLAGATGTCRGPKDELSSAQLRRASSSSPRRLQSARVLAGSSSFRRMVAAPRSRRRIVVPRSTRTSRSPASAARTR